MVLRLVVLSKLICRVVYWLLHYYPPLCLLWSVSLQGCKKKVRGNLHQGWTTYCLASCKGFRLCNNVCRFFWASATSLLVMESKASGFRSSMCFFKAVEGGILLYIVVVDFGGLGLVKIFSEDSVKALMASCLPISNSARVMFFFCKISLRLCPPFCFKISFKFGLFVVLDCRSTTSTRSLNSSEPKWMVASTALWFLMMVYWSAGVTCTCLRLYYDF